MKTLCVATLLLLSALVAARQAQAAVVTEIEQSSLTNGRYTLETGKAYYIEEEGTYTLTTNATTVDAVLSVSLGTGRNITLNLDNCLIETVSTTYNSSYYAALRVSGTGCLTLRHVGEQTSTISLRDSGNLVQPVVDLYYMTGGEVRFERDSSLHSSSSLVFKRTFGYTTGEAVSATNQALPVIKGGSNVRLTFASESNVEIQGTVLVKSSTSEYILPPLITNGVKAIVVQESANLVVRPYQATGTIVSKNYTWTTQPLFSGSPIVLEGGSLTTDKVAYNTVALPAAKIEEAISQATGAGIIFGKQLITFPSAPSTTIPAGCFTGDADLTEAERTTDATGKLVIDAAKNASVVYTEGSSPGAEQIFGVRPTFSETGCEVRVDFGIENLSITQGAEGQLTLSLDLAVDLPDETEDSRDFLIGVVKKEEETGVETTAYPLSGAAAAATTFTRVEASSPRFHATVTTSFILDKTHTGVSTFSVRAYSSLPTE